MCAWQAGRLAGRKHLHTQTYTHIHAYTQNPSRQMTSYVGKKEVG